MGQKQVAVNARQVVEALDVGDGTEFSQVVVALLVLGQQRNLEAVVFLAAVQVVAAEVGVNAHNGFELGASLWTVLIVRLHSLHKLKGAHHVAQVREGYRGLAVVGGTLNKLRNLGRGLQHAELAVHVKVKKGNSVGSRFKRPARPWLGGVGVCGRRRSGRGRLSSRGWRSLLKASLEVGTGFFEVAVLDSNGQDFLGMGCNVAVELGLLHAQVCSLPMTAASQFPKAASGGLHVSGRIVSLHKGCIEQRTVEFREFCWLESASPRNAHQSSRLGRHGIDYGQLHPIGFKADSQKFCAKDVEIKL